MTEAEKWKVCVNCGVGDASVQDIVQGPAHTTHIECISALREFSVGLQCSIDSLESQLAHAEYESNEWERSAKTLAAAIATLGAGATLAFASGPAATTFTLEHQSAADPETPEKKL